MRRFIGLRHEGDLDTSEYNERLLVAVAQYVRERPKAGGDLVVAKTVSGQVSAIILSPHLPVWEGSQRSRD